VHPLQLTLLLHRQLWLPPLQLALRPSNSHPLTCTHPDQVNLELGERGQDIEEHLAHRVIRVIYPAAEREHHTASGKGVTDISGIRDRPRESIQFRHHERVARSYSGQRLIQPGPFALGAADTVVDVDAIRRNPERQQRLRLGREVLFVG